MVRSWDDLHFVGYHTFPFQVFTVLDVTTSSRLCKSVWIMEAKSLILIKGLRLPAALITHLLITSSHDSLSSRLTKFGYHSMAQSIFYWISQWLTTRFECLKSWYIFGLLKQMSAQHQTSKITKKELNLVGTYLCL